MMQYYKLARDFLSGTPTREDWIAFAVIIGVSVLILAGFLFGLKPRMAKVTEQLKSNDAKVFAVLEEAIEKSKEVKKLEAETQNVQGLVHEFELRLPTTREITRLVQDFEQMASAENVRIEFSSLATMNDGRKETIPYSIVAHGSFHQLAGFINKLELFKRFLKITDLEIGPQEDGIARAKFKLNTYRFLDDAGATS